MDIYSPPRARREREKARNETEGAMAVNGSGATGGSGVPKERWGSRKALSERIERIISGHILVVKGEERRRA